MSSLVDVPGIRLGHHSRGDTGVTVIAAPDGAVGAVDVRGGGPGTRETDLLEAHNTVERVHAIALCGGSAFGLAAADGVMQELEREGIGFPVFGPGQPGPIVPIVPAAVIFDLAVGDPANRPGAADGVAATRAALHSGGAATCGSIGAGCGATAGRLRGGFGQALAEVGEWKIGAGVVANPVGEVIDPESGRFYGDATLPGVDPEKFSGLPGKMAQLNTTIGVIATDAPLSKAQAKRVAIAAHDGIARAVRPSHLPMDGDTLFVMATGDGSGVEVAELARLCAAAAELVTASIVKAVRAAEPGLGLSSYRELSA
ncbi:Peptidase family S58 [Corynebacterium occultum]|uniref:Peptidase family S58 n=1 Tax=Corynebacterium occultum TaxID=2675219 RepID=A0A6B8WBD6_9CORY|nr:P1 family peptidase [Corynebacterium occultum]QGU08156.1 Peptidase family S58 [Corynebacterium occultum]